MDEATAVKPTPPAKRRRADAGARDAFVLIAMCVVVVAVGIGLYMHFETGFLLALVAALAAYAGLLTVHVLVRRSQTIHDLKAEVARLNQQIGELRRSPGMRTQEAGLSAAPAGRPAMPRNLDAPPGPVPVPALPGSQVRMPGPGSGAAPNGAGPVAPPLPATGSELPLQATKDGDSPVSRERTPMPPAEPPPMPMSSITAPRPSPPPAAVPALRSAGPIPAAPPTASEIAAPSAPMGGMPFGRMPAPPVSPPPSLAEGRAPAPASSALSPWAMRPGELRAQTESVSAAVPQPVAEAPAPGDRVAARLQEIGSAVQHIAAGAPPPAAKPSPASLPPPVQGAAHARAWPQPDAELPRHPAMEPVAPPPEATVTGDAPSFAMPATEPMLPPASVGSPALPPEPATDKPESAVREFETMQLLIKQLAAQLNAPAPPAAASQEAASVLANEAISQSVAVLRSTADSMRSADSWSESEESDEKDEARAESEPDHAGTPHARAAEAEADAPAPARENNTGPADLERAPANDVASAPSPYGRLALIAEAVSADRIEVFLDPILALAERRARHFEVSVRLRTSDDDVIGSDDYLAIAGETGLLPQIDAAKLDRTARVAARLRARGSNGSLFSALAGESLADDGFLNTFADLFGAETDISNQLILTFSQRDVRAFGEAHWDAVATMADIGLRFALDQVSHLDMDFERLRQSGFTFVKLDSQVFLEGLPAPGGAIPAADICGYLSGLGLGLIVGHIEDDRDLAKIAGFGVIFGQGILFGAPRPIRVDPQPGTAAA